MQRNLNLVVNSTLDVVKIKKFEGSYLRKREKDKERYLNIDCFLEIKNQALYIYLLMYRHSFMGTMQKYLLLDTIALYIAFFLCVKRVQVIYYQSNRGI